MNQYMHLSLVALENQRQWFVNDSRKPNSEKHNRRMSKVLNQIEINAIDVAIKARKALRS